MKTREKRRNVFLKARMRDTSDWRDICIRNISSRGMMIETLDAPPKRGTHVEVRRGHQTIIARIVWSRHQSCGAYVQDRIDVDALLGERDLSGTDYAQAKKADPAFERRRAPRRPGASADPSRHLARAGQFAAVAAVGIVLAGVVVTLAGQTFSAPLSRVMSALGG